MDNSTISIVLGVLLGVSEILSMIKKVHPNGILELVVDVLKGSVMTIKEKTIVESSKKTQGVQTGVVNTIIEIPAVDDKQNTIGVQTSAYDAVSSIKEFQQQTEDI
jgi:hypothetical protein